MLHGPPGTGKTSFVQAVAAKLKLNICYLNLSGGNLDDDQLNNLLNNSPLKSIILIEDIDAIFLERASVQAQRCRVSFSGLLNALDGVRSQEGRVLIMTTNHPEKLDPALLRPGRADLKIELNNASVMQLQKMYHKFFPDSTKEQQEQFSNQLPDKVISMAKLQGHFLKFRDRPEDCIKNASNLLDLDFQLKDMSIYEWLRRLNLHKYAPAFRKQGIKRVSDLRFMNDGSANTAGITQMLKRRRIVDMVAGEDHARTMFGRQTKSQARTIIAHFTKNIQE